MVAHQRIQETSISESRSLDFEKNLDLMRFDGKINDVIIKKLLRYNEYSKSVLIDILGMEFQLNIVHKVFKKF